MASKSISEVVAFVDGFLASKAGSVDGVLASKAGSVCSTLGVKYSMLYTPDLHVKNSRLP